MRKAMQERGVWRGQGPSHSVPAQEEGEPPAKKHERYANTLAGTDLGAPLERTPPAAASSDDEPPPLEASPTPEGNGVSEWGLLCLGMGEV